MSKDKAKQMGKRIMGKVIAAIIAILMILSVAATCIYYIIYS